MLVLGIDPGSLTTGWALLKSEGRKIFYVGSGVLEFNKKEIFLDRLTDIKVQFSSLIKEVNPHEIALESLIYVKSPTALIKLAQARGILLSEIVESHRGKIFEYSPNLVKSSAVGHGHADKESVKKGLDLYLGKRDYKTFDESDAVAVALCHLLNRDKGVKTTPKSRGRGLAASLAHKVS